MRDWDLSAMRLDHATVGVLSEKTPARTYRKSTRWLSTIYWRSTAAISRSELVRHPRGFFVRYYLARDGVRKMDQPHNWPEPGFATHPDPTGSRCTCVTISNIVIVAGNQFFNVGRSRAETADKNGQVQQGCLYLAVFAEANAGGFACERFVDERKQPFGNGHDECHMP